MCFIINVPKKVTFRYTIDDNITLCYASRFARSAKRIALRACLQPAAACSLRRFALRVKREARAEREALRSNPQMTNNHDKKPLSGGYL